ncbi:hypothetical protein GCM10010517_57120 [Streptosporangium fragile]|uniref:Uncharacterized protein n=1 Tax=Streptosporangium fragile TaxID=46186 RepID=A0ABP6IK79_9ACTN
MAFPYCRASENSRGHRADRGRTTSGCSTRRAGCTARIRQASPASRRRSRTHRTRTRTSCRSRDSPRHLQTDCLSGVLAKSIWPSFGRTAKDWNELLGLLKANGDVKGQDRTSGKGANRVARTKLGYTGGDPGACNTWTAAPSKVA